MSGRSPGGFLVAVLAAGLVLTGLALTGARAGSLDAGGGLCARAAQAAELRYTLPTGLLLAIGQVESGRPNAVTHRREPWPWTVQSEGQSYYFDSEPEAVKWVAAARARGVISIDVGCMQVNLFYHPRAFATTDAAFDPDTNADYAARFLLALHGSGGDWRQAIGFYHSQTLALAVPYRQRVEDALNGKLPEGGTLAPPPPTQLSLLQAAWAATLDPAREAAPAALITNDWSVLMPRPRLDSPVKRRARPRHGEVLLSYAH